MSWGTKKRNKFLLILSIFILIIASIVILVIFYEKPTCFDGKKNGGELEVDCGGGCQLLCNKETFDLITLWYRSFEVAPGIHNVIALIENPNLNAGANNISYKFELLDEEGIPLETRIGKYNIRPREIFPIFESGLNTGKLSPDRLSFEMDNQLIWERQIERPKDLIIKDEIIDESEKNFSRIKATIQNITIDPVFDISFVVILYDKNNNAFASSSTFLEKIHGSESKDIVFTWPKNFNDEIVRFEIIPIYE